jgi:TonB-linked SusC/RagA family outer membrane protein
MNKHSIEERGHLNNLKHALKVMRTTLFLLFFCVLFTSASNSFSQELTLIIESTSIKDVCKEIERNSDFIFVFSDTSEKLVDKKVDINANSKKVEEILDLIFMNSGLTYKILDKQIVIYESNMTASVKDNKYTASTFVKQQKKQISGIVTDIQGEPIIGANIIEAGTTNGTVTDINGNFVLNVADNATIRISYLGYIEQNISIAGKSSINITLKEDTQTLEDLVVIGYGSMKKRDVTGSITSITSEDITKKIPANVYEALQGQAPGVQVVMGSGQPGETATIKIRGTSTFSEAGVKPLYIVDGAPLESIDGINPSDIESMEILKDAASASIYGSRSANGVILITTRGGVREKPSFDIKYNRGWGQLSHKLPQANRSDRREYDIKRREYFLANGMPGNANESIQMIEDSLNVFFNVDNDYQKMISQTAQKDQIDLSIGGAGDKIKYFVNTGFFNEKGIIPNTSFQRLTTRVNSDYEPYKWLNMGTRLSLGYSLKKGINEGQLLNAMLSRRPYFSTYYPDGTLVGIFNGQRNPIAQIEHTTDYTDAYTANFFQFMEFGIAKNLKFRTNINANFYLNKRKRLYPSIITDEWQRSNSGGSFNYLNWNWLSENFFTYSNTWDQHNLGAMLGASIQKWYNENEILQGINSSTDFIYTMNAFAANLDLTQTGSWISKHSLASIFSRITYDYRGKYLFAANFRRDGSSRFSENNKWGNFPSISAGWRFSDELFMKKAKSVLDDGKIRVSYGITGNEAIGNYDYIYSYIPSIIYDGIGGVSPARIAKDNLKWEETKQLNTGLDLSFFNSRLIITADYYNKNTDGLLANYQLPKESGFSYMRTNVGEMNNKGYELMVSGDIIRKSDLTWNASFNISYNKNKIIKLSEGKSYLEGGLWWMEEGGSIGDFYGYKNLGVFQYDESNAFSDKWEQLTPVFENGVFAYKYLLNGSDYSGTVNVKKLPNGKAFRGGDYNWAEIGGEENGIIDDNDKMVIGNAMPKYTGGLSTQVRYKQVTLFVSFYYSLGGKIYNDAEHNRNAFRFTGTTPSPKVIHDLWLKQGDISNYPRPYNDEFNNARYANSFYLEDGSYIRLQNVRMSYEFEKEILKKLRLKGLSIYGYINNPLTWTKYSGYDPEFSSSNPLQIGKDTYRYPMKREFGLGLNINI